ncbi:MAG: branched-chain amino acid ABC transporter permease [Clostridiales bacterium]|nr:branched-chain amino acid ABC transporter permease [Clostridiales bacterium]
MSFINQLINGLQVGSIYALIALGYTMVYGIVQLINFAHGDIIMVGAYISLLLLTVAGLPIYLVVPLTMIACAAVGMLIERVAYRPLRNSAQMSALLRRFSERLLALFGVRHKGGDDSAAPRISALITAIGVSLLLQNLFMLVMSPNPRSYPNIIALAPLEVGSLRVSYTTIITIATSVLLMIVLHMFTKHSRTGKAMRAVSENMAAARLMGINVDTTITITFAIGSALAAVGAILYCAAYPQVQPYMGSMPGLKAFIAAVLGGIGMLPGAMLGGFIMGIAESLTKGFISTQFADAVVFGILILVLVFKPSGLLGKGGSEKV